MSAELHVSSLIVQGRPERLPGIEALISGIPGAEVHAMQCGKLVVTLETQSETEILDRLAAITSLDGVYSACLVYHQVEAGTEVEGER